MFPFHRVTITSFIKLWSIIICFILGISSCTIEKQYHSWGWKINTSNSISANKRSKENSSTNTAGALNHRNNTASKDNTTSNRNYSSVATQIKNKLPNSSANSIFDGTSSNLTAQKYSTVKFKNPSELNPTNWLSQPQDTVFFPEKYQHRKHGTLYLPQIKNEDDFNTATAHANFKDVAAWNWFDRGHISSKIALYWLFAFLSLIIIIGLGNISLVGIATNTRKTVTTILILIPALLFAIGYICYLLGTFSIWKANKLYKNALNKLPYDLKLKADAIIMHARIPYVSKGATLRHAKRILTTYPNDRNGEWLEDVSKTKQEIETGRTSLTINNWSRMRTVGFIVTLLLIAFSAIIFL